MAGGESHTGERLIETVRAGRDRCDASGSGIRRACGGLARRDATQVTQFGSPEEHNDMEIKENRVYPRAFIRIGYCRVFGRSECRIGRWTRGFRSVHKVVPGDGVQSCGCNLLCTVVPRLYYGRHPAGGSLIGAGGHVASINSEEEHQVRRPEVPCPMLERPPVLGIRRGERDSTRMRMIRAWISLIRLVYVPGSHRML